MSDVFHEFSGTHAAFTPYFGNISRQDIKQGLIEIWQQTLDSEELGIHDDFFALGGDSFLFLHMMAQVQTFLDQRGGGIDLSTLLKQAIELTQISANADLDASMLTIERFVDYIEKKRAEQQTVEEDQEVVSNNQPLPPLQRISYEPGELLPLSYAQQRLWFLDQLEPGQSTYSAAVAVELRGVLRLAVLEKALMEMIRRHEILRTTFPAVDGQPSQVIASSKGVPLSITDLKSLSAVERTTEREKMLGQMARRPFDLAQGPLWRIGILLEEAERQVLVLVVHHILADGWAMEIWWRELSTIYSCFLNEEPVNLPVLPLQYASYAYWQRQWLDNDVIESQLAYWKQQLSDAPPLLQILSDRPRSLKMTHRGARYVLSVANDVTHALRLLSQENNVTLFMTLLAAFQILLFRYSGQEDLCIGTPIANRQLEESKELIGLFANTLVLRTYMGGNPTFEQFLKRVRKTALEAYLHPDLPFEKLVEVLQPARDLSYHPLFQVMFALHNFPKKHDELILAGLESNSIDVPRETVPFDLAMTLWEDGDRLWGEIEYSTELFDHETVERMMGHWQMLLLSIIANPHQHITTLPLLPASEIEQLQRWNATSRDYPREKCLHELFEMQAAKTPEALALITTDGQISYEHLNRRANQLAHYLSAQGVAAEVPVGVGLERSVDLIVGILGILKAGGAYVPLDLTYPAERLTFMLKDAQVKMVLTRQRFAALFSEWPVLFLDAISSVLAQEPGTNLPQVLNSAHLTYVIYTSGSTGRPKGVQISHRAVVNHFATFKDSTALQEDDRVLQFASVSFDAAVEEIFPPLLTGAALVLRPPDSLDFFNFERVIAQEQITILNLPTAYWHSWVAHLSRSSAVLPSSLRMVIIGGEAASAEGFALWQRLLNQSLRWINTYGPTETTITATLYEPTGADKGQEGQNMLIGRPIANAQAYVLDDQRQLVPIGVAGELHIGGEGLARGYLNLPDLTAERFVPHPFATGERLYSTGDRVCYLPDGNLKFLGRTDHQVKLRGYRIELGEIEATLRLHAAIEDAVVLVREERPDDPYLVAYVVTKTEQATPPDSFHLFLQEKLPAYMIPTRYISLSEFPLTSNGKIDRQALPRPDRARGERAEAYVAPKTEIELIIASIWEEILQRDKIGIYDNFFILGGHSLRATQVIARLNAAFGIELAVRQLFESSNIATMAIAVEEALISKLEGLPEEQVAQLLQMNDTGLERF